MRFMLQFAFLATGTLLSLTASLATASIAFAQSAVPVAIVEDASPDAPVAMFEYLSYGQKIELKGNDRVVIGYLSTCRLETIAGGTVRIGKDRSTVTAGLISAEQVECDGGRIQLTREAAAASGVTVYRGPDQADRMLYSATPVLDVGQTHGDGALEIRRLDRPESPLRFEPTEGRVDLAEASSPLNPGGLYEARYGERELIFRIVVYARPGGPLVGRVARF